MANATENRSDSYRPSGGMIKRFPVLADEVLVYGGIVSVNADGFLKNAADAANETLAGVCLDYIDATGDTSGDQYAMVDIGGAEVKATHEDGSMSQANVGDAVVQQLNNEVTSAGTGTHDIPAGVISEIVSATVVWVKLRPYGVAS